MKVKNKSSLCSNQRVHVNLFTDCYVTQDTTQCVYVCATITAIPLANIPSVPLVLLQTLLSPSSERVVHGNNTGLLVLPS